MSRPVKTTETARTEKIGARLTISEANLVKARAAAKKQRLAVYARERLLSEAR